MPTAWLPYDSNEVPLSGMSFLCSSIILCSQGIVMPPFYTIFSCNYWNYSSASFWSFTRCQELLNSTVRQILKLSFLLNTGHKYQHLSSISRSWIDWILRFICKEDPATSSAIGDDQTDHCYSFSGTSASRGLTLFKQPNFKVHDLGEGRRGRQLLLSD